MEELMKHRGHKEKEHHHHHHLHLFHLPGHHHHGHKEHQQQQQTATFENYREVSSAIDEPSNSNAAPAGSASSALLKLTVGRIE